MGVQPLEIVVCDRDYFGDAQSFPWETIRLESISETGQCRREQDDHEIIQIRTVVGTTFHCHLFTSFSEKRAR